MARRAADDADRTIACPHCGEAIRRDARSCRHCGSDAATGWRDHDLDAEVELPEAMSDAEYDEFLAGEPAIADRSARSGERAPPSDALLRRRRRLALALLLALLIAGGGALVLLL